MNRNHLNLIQKYSKFKNIEQKNEKYNLKLKNQEKKREIFFSLAAISSNVDKEMNSKVKNNYQEAKHLELKLKSKIIKSDIDIKRTQFEYEVDLKLILQKK
jgi:hypothetical protein